MSEGPRYISPEVMSICASLSHMKMGSDFSQQAWIEYTVTERQFFHFGKWETLSPRVLQYFWRDSNTGIVQTHLLTARKKYFTGDSSINFLGVTFRILPKGVNPVCKVLLCKLIHPLLFYFVPDPVLCTNLFKQNIEAVKFVVIIAVLVTSG